MIVSISGLHSLAYCLSLQSVSLLTLYRVLISGSGISPASFFTIALASLGLLHFYIISKSLVSFHTHTHIYKHMRTNLPGL